MNGTRAARSVIVVCAATLIGAALSAQAVKPVGRSRFYATGAASSLVDQGLMSPAPTSADAAAFEPVPNPGIRNVPNSAQATTAPWIDSNAWRVQRGLR